MLRDRTLCEVWFAALDENSIIIELSKCDLLMVSRSVECFQNFCPQHKMCQSPKKNFYGRMSSATGTTGNQLLNLIYELESCNKFHLKE